MKRRRPPVPPAPPGPGAIVITGELPDGYQPPSASIDPNATTSQDPRG